LDDFEKLLLQYKGEDFLVINPPGSKGDQLILMGLEKKLIELSIRYRLYHLRSESSFHKICDLADKQFLKYGTEAFRKNWKRITSTINNIAVRKAHSIPETSSSVLLLRGGAYLNDVWKEYSLLFNTFRAIQNKPNSIIIISPHSFYFISTRFTKFFDKIKQPVHIFCREKYSYHILESMSFPKNVHIHLSHDTSLYLSKEDFSLKNWNESYILIAPRNDRESVVIWDKRKIHGSTKILFGDIIKLNNFNDYVNIIWNARQVYTDRLHNAILSAILGKDTFLYPVSYHKNKGVYEFSLSVYPNVKFITSYEFQGVKS
jgi:exopolysaccharide biosynthesis predicted pyruvyltransferase EpsI